MEIDIACGAIFFDEGYFSKKNLQNASNAAYLQ